MGADATALAPDATLRIRTVARLTGIREATLRAWERRYGFPTPVRSGNNYRAYSREEAEAVRRVARLLQQGYAVSEAIQVVRATPTEALPIKARIEERFWSAVMVLDEAAAHLVLEEAERLLPPLELADEVLLPLLRRMALRLDVAREHLASATIRQRLRRLVECAPKANGRATVVLACPSGDRHEGGLLGLALHLRHAGWKTVLLGGDTPADALSTAVKQSGAQLVALSFVRHYEPIELESLVRSVLRQVPVPVVVGGPGAQEHLSFLRASGVYFAGSASELRLLARGLGVPDA